MENEDENFPFRQLSENEQKFLILLFELESLNEMKTITKEVLVKSGNEIFGKNRTDSQIENSITNTLNSIQKISKNHFSSKYNGNIERYVVSTSNAEGKKTGYRLADKWLITTEKIAKYGELLVKNAQNSRIEKVKAINIGNKKPINMTSEEVIFNLERLVNVGYLSDEITKYKIEERLRSFESTYLAKLVDEFDENN